MSKVWFTIMFIIMPAFALYAQKEGHIWAFGTRAGLDFNSGTPQVISTAINYTGVREGCASVCNAAGRLQFYTNGSEIWNRNHAIMPNGNLGIITGSTTQGALIVPVPGSEYLYYIFSLEPSDLTTKQRLYYSVVDMRLDNGLGNVVSNQKAILLKDSLSERMTAVAGDNCDVWIVTRFDFRSEYIAYRLTSGGLNTTPVVSPITSVNMPFILGQCGMMKFSHDRRKLVAGRRGNDGLLEMADFNPATGVVSNNVIISQNPSSSVGYYGMCFSPDDTRLYVTTGYASPSQLIQYDLSLNTLSAIQASATVLHTHNQSGSGIGDIKGGPDGKLYFVTSTSSVFNSTYLHVINNPNMLGAQSQVTLNAIPLAANSLSGHGLPNQIVILPAKDTISAKHNVALCEASVQLPVDTTGSFYEWENGNRIYRRVVSRAGTYAVSYRKACTIFIDTFYVREVQFPVLDPPEIKCEDEDGFISFQASDTTTFSYICMDSSGNVISTVISDHGAVLQPLKQGWYKVLIRTLAGSCEREFEVRVLAHPLPHTIISPGDTTIRYGDEIRLQASGALQYSWSPTQALKTAASIPDPVAQLFKTTIFTVVGTNEYGCSDSASVQINIDYFIADLIPNAFSPNGDGHNDVFHIAGLTYQQIIFFKVFNRYGQEIFYSQSADKGWDGTYNGNICDAGTYYYLIELQYPSGERKRFKGDVALLR